MLIKVKVIPNSSEDRVVGEENGLLKVKVRTPPEKGRANLALIELLAKHFQLPKRCIIIQSGHANPIKYIILDKK